uniref:DUF4297 domain-containing protein n=1 Tax=Panagrolaimus davidi TaxID=227884 RepID=A0A914Q0M0_9BILA
MGEFEEKQIDIKKQYSGTTYQIKVLLLLLCRGKKIKSYDDFYLKTEVKDAEKFDDALFYYKKKGEEIYNVRYCQVKNSESKNAELKYNDFVSDYDKAVANIKKYFISYRKIKMRTVNKNVEDFTLCTSYKLPLELKKNEKADGDAILTFIEDGASDELFGNIPNQLKKYKIAKISSELNNSLLKTTNLDLLAEELIEAVLKCKKQESSTVILECGNMGNNASQEIQTDIVEKLAKKISEYIFETKPLTNEIFGQNEFLNNVFKIADTSLENSIKFTGDFVQNKNLTKTAEQFRKYFLESYTILELKNLKLKLVQSFKVDNKFETLINNDDDIENEMEQFFEEFSIQTMPHHDELMDIIKKEIGEEFNLLEDKWVTKSLLEKVEEWFKKSEEIPFDKSNFDIIFLSAT